MRLKRIRAGYVFSFKELVRMRIAIVLLLVVPTVFFLVIDHTTTDELVDFVVGTISEDALITTSAKGLSLIFVGIASVGFLTAFLGLTLIQRQTAVNQRLILCGFHPAELIVSKLGVLASLTVVISVYVAGVLLVFFRPEGWLGVTLGFILGGFVYGCYGLLIGSLLRRDLEGILFIVLLANIDAGWLQNPIYYTAAQNTELIRQLPAYYPSQVSLVSAFSQFSAVWPVVGSIAYGSILLGFAVFFYWRKTRVCR